LDFELNITLYRAIEEKLEQFISILLRIEERINGSEKAIIANSIASEPIVPVVVKKGPKPTPAQLKFQRVVELCNRITNCKIISH